MKNIKNILIIGAGEAGISVYREIKSNPNLNFSVVGFIDDDPEKFGKNVNGVKVIGIKKDLIGIIKKTKIKEVIIAIPSAEGEQIADYVKLCSSKSVDVRIVPRVREIIEGKAHVKTLRRVRVEDLLSRPVIKTDVLELKKFFKGKSVLVTGAAGSIGSELSRQIAAYKPRKLVLLDWWENGIFEIRSELKKDFPKLDMEFVIGNIQDIKKVREVILIFKPNYVFHAAAYKHVSLMEDNPTEAVKNNIFGTLNVVRESLYGGVEKFVIVSTDKAANPKSVMGATKLFTEAIGRYYNVKGKTKYMAVRFGNVLDSYGSVVPVFRKQIEEGGPVTITDKKMRRYFMTIPEAAQLILKAGAIGKGGELFVLDMGEPVRIIDLAETMIRLSGLIPGEDIKIVYTGKKKGEKIREVLFIKKEKDNLITTRDRKIFITQSLGMDVAKIEKSIQNFIDLVKNGNKVEIRKELSRIIPGFHV